MIPKSRPKTQDPRPKTKDPRPKTQDKDHDHDQEIERMCPPNVPYPPSDMTLQKKTKKKLHTKKKTKKKDQKYNLNTMADEFLS